MRIERLDLAPYGRFSDRSLNLSPEASLHVVFGVNESGKTTTLSALGDLLFGFKRGATPYDFLHNQKTLRIGGRVRFANGQTFEWRRRKGEKDTALDRDDKPISESPLAAALAGIDRATFEAEFGLTSQALRAGGEALLSAGGALAETLAAGSASLSAVNAARQKLAAEADALFSPRRSANKPFYVALDAHADADRRLRDSVVTAEALRAADEALLAARAREIDLKARHEETGRLAARLRRAERCREKLARLDAAVAEMAVLGDLPETPAPALDAAKTALQTIRARSADLARLAAEEARETAERAALGLDPALLAQGAAIDALGEDLGAVRKAEEDLPRRLGEHAQARDRLEEIARRLGLEDHTQLAGATPSDAALARAKALVEKRARLRERRLDAAARRREAMAERARLGPPRAEASDPAPLKARLDGFAPAAAESDRLDRQRAEVERETRALAEEAAALDPTVADLDALARMSLPAEEALQRGARHEQTAADALRAAIQTRDAAERAADAALATLRKHETGPAAATRAEWQAARERRDQALDRLAQSLDGALESRRERFETARAQTETADAVVERVLVDVERGARLQAAREALSERREDAKRAGEAHAAATAAAERARQESQALWASSGIALKETTAMVLWRQRAGVLLLRRATLAKSQADIAVMAERVEAARLALLAWFADAGAAPPAASNFAETYRAARARLESVQADWLAAREQNMAAEQAEKAIAEAEALLARAGKAEAELAAEWPEAMRDIRLRVEASEEEARAALTAWSDLPAPQVQFRDLSHRIATMQDDVAGFARGVAEAVAAAAPALAGLKAREALPRLATALKAARQAAQEEARLARQAARRAAEVEALKAEQASLSGNLAELGRKLGAVDEETFGLALERLERRRALEVERDALRRDLVSAGDGLDEAQLRAEQATLATGALPAQIELADEEQKRLLQEIGEAAAATSAAATLRAALELGRDAAGAARQREEARADLLDIAERWLVRTAAAKLANRAIERHRAAAQDPLIARAGEMFALAAAGHFAGLGIDYARDRPELVACRPGGETVEVAGLSEGARDQLFLALRLALLERRAGEPLPFVGDDLLASFDDERARHTLALLADFGAKRQAILFTHHARIAELAKQVARVEAVTM